MDQAGVVTVLQSIPNSSYATPVLNIGGTNAAPGGTYQAPADPLTPSSWTGLEAIYQANRKANPWMVTFNSGVAEDLLLGTTQTYWDSASGSGTTYYNKFQAVAGTAGSIRVNLAGSSNVRVALYSDSSGSPGTVLATGSLSGISGWNTIPLNVTVSVTGAAYYWIGVQVDTASRLNVKNSTGTCKTTSEVYGSEWVNSPSVGSSSAYEYASTCYGMKVV